MLGSRNVDFDAKFVIKKSYGGVTFRVGEIFGGVDFFLVQISLLKFENEMYWYVPTLDIIFLPQKNQCLRFVDKSPWLPVVPFPGYTHPVNRYSGQRAKRG